jgi:hypothetical protein
VHEHLARQMPWQRRAFGLALPGALGRLGRRSQLLNLFVHRLQVFFQPIFQWAALLGAQCRTCAVCLITPGKAPPVERPSRQPQPKVIVHQYLHPGAAGVGKQLSVMGMSRAKDLHHPRQGFVEAGAHVQRLCGHQDRFDANDRSRAANSGAEHCKLTTESAR